MIMLLSSAGSVKLDVVDDCGKCPVYHRTSVSSNVTILDNCLSGSFCQRMVAVTTCHSEEIPIFLFIFLFFVYVFFIGTIYFIYFYYFFIFYFNVFWYHL